MYAIIVFRSIDGTQQALGLADIFIGEKAVNQTQNYRGMSSWWPLLELSYGYSIFKSSHCNSFEDRAPDKIYGTPDHQMSCRNLTRMRAYHDGTPSNDKHALLVTLLPCRNCNHILCCWPFCLIHMIELWLSDYKTTIQNKLKTSMP